MSSITRGRGGSHSRPSWKIPNMKHSTQTRQLHEWVLLFPVEDGYDNMLLAGQDFYDFWNDPSITKMSVNGKLILTGQLYGCHGHKNGDIPKKRPSYVVSLERLSHQEFVPSSRKQINCLDRDVMRLYTDDGEQYFFVKSDIHPCTAEFLSYFSFGGELNHHVPDEYKENDIM